LLSYNKENCVELQSFAANKEKKTKKEAKEGNRK